VLTDGEYQLHVFFSDSVHRTGLCLSRLARRGRLALPTR
jgi:hypothetical protein